MREINFGSPLLTDLYQLTMAASYYESEMDQMPATFSLFIRAHPRRSYFIAAGLQEVLAQIESFQFSTNDLTYLSSLSLFDPRFLDYLSKLRFEGDIFAMPEGSVFFADEPLVEISAPILQSQLLETFLINAIGSASLIATKAARCVQAAGDRPVIDFALRRTHGATAGMTTARSSYVGGFSATSNVMAGKQYGLPVAGTMAHSYVSAFESEVSAFRAYARNFPDNAVFLIDTYDSVSGAHHAVQVALEMASAGHRLNGVRLDSGDMVSVSKNVRHILDRAGLGHVKIFASSGFDEYKIEQVLHQGAKIDAFGVGTKMGVSADAPYLDIVYKLVQLADRPIKKFSPGKLTLAAPKQVFRRVDSHGKYSGDTITIRGENPPQRDAVPLLKKVMENGRIISDDESLEDLQCRCQEQLDHLALRFKRTKHPSAYPVRISSKLEALQKIDPQ